MRSIAFYLPQYHPTPENDEWWGTGFTDWDNVARGRPQFAGHYQPHVPSELGCYDLRDPSVREAQAQLASEYGISGFCYFHYWFEGRRLLHLPLDDVLRTHQPDFPFCLCWANENWTRVWDGNERELLIQQTYSPTDDDAHIEWLASVFDDPRYIRVDGRPLFVIYRAISLPDAAKTIDRWRERAVALGIGELYLCRVDSYHQPRDDPRKVGLDAAIEFHPDRQVLSSFLAQRVVRRVGRRIVGPRGPFRNKVIDYQSYVDRAMRRPDPPYPLYPCVTPSWDNVARRARDATILRGSTPDGFEAWVSRATDRAFQRHLGDPMIFVNAWNEWAEGNHLEPCQQWGRAYLEAHQRGVRRGQPVPDGT
jgi:lipopolysaccharide biosynthesis protein